MDNILDSSDKENKPTNIFSKLSFAFSVVEILLVLYLFVQTPSRVRASEALSNSPFILMTILFFVVIFGFISTIIGIVKKERVTLIKWAGAVINFLLFIIMSMLLLIGI